MAVQATPFIPQRNESEFTHFGRAPADHLMSERLVGISRWATEARGLVAAHAAHDNPVWLEGEPGSGKEHLARLIHESSARRHEPFITFACDTVSEESADLALFGSVYTTTSGRSRVQKGLVEAAAGGTLYLSGIVAASPSLQAKIARLIQYQEFCRPGDELIEAADVRLLFGQIPSHHPEKAMVRSLLSVRDTLSILPLRERSVDIEALTRSFINQACRLLEKEPREPAASMIARLCHHDWPGNIDELRAVIEGIVQESRPPVLDASHLPAYLFGPTTAPMTSFPTSGVDLANEVKHFEKTMLCAALKQSHGQQTKAAKLLGLKTTTLNMKIARYDIDVAAFK